LESSQNIKITKIHIIFLTILLVINFCIFYFPGLPGSIPRVIGKSTGVTIPDMRLRYTVDELHAFLTGIGSEGRQAFQWMHLSTDLAFPLIYGLLLYSIIYRLSFQLGWPGKRLSLLGFLPTVFDLVENFSLLYITSQYPNIPQVFGSMINYLTIGKFLFLMISLCIILFLRIKIILRKNKNNKTD